VFVVVDIRYRVFIVNKLNDIVYESKLAHSNERRGVFKWHDHDVAETKSDDTSRKNEYEANMVLEFYRTCACQAGSKEIMITSFYAAQIRLLRELIGDVLREQDRIVTIDSSQGSETDIMLISCVRKDGIGFCKNKQRLNVAISRTKDELHMFGHKDTFKRFSKMWRKLCKNT